MSERSFSRHYVQATGTTPPRCRRLRVEALGACSRTHGFPLSGSRSSAVSARKRRCGEAFCGLLAATPQDYRERFGV